MKTYVLITAFLCCIAAQDARYGIRCQFSEECSELSQICADINGIQRCICDKYHEYNRTLAHCVPRRNLTNILEERFSHEVHIANQAESTFSGILIGGILIICIGLISLIICFIYCFRMHLSDRKLNKIVQTLSSKVDVNKLASIKEETADKTKLTEASIGPICLDDVVIG